MPRVQMEQQSGPHSCHQPWMLWPLDLSACQQTQCNIVEGVNSPRNGPAPLLISASLISLLCRQHQSCCSPQNHPWFQPSTLPRPPASYPSHVIVFLIVLDFFICVNFNIGFNKCFLFAFHCIIVIAVFTQLACTRPSR